MGSTTAALVMVLSLVWVTPAIAAGQEPATHPNDVTGDVDSFGGYVGYLGDDPGPAADLVVEEGPKAEPLGPIGTPSPHRRDVAGQEPSAPDAVALPPLPEQTYVGDDVRQAVASGATARVIVLMRSEMRLDGALTAAELADQRAAIAESLDGLSETLSGTGSVLVRQLEVVPSAVYTLTEAGLDALLSDPDVAAVTLDGQVSTQLDSSTGVIDSDLLNLAGVLGNNYEGNTNGGAYHVAVIDSGVDGVHSAFSGRIVSEACYVTDSSCLGGTNSSVQPGSGEDCTHSSDCDHGTHVAGIAAGAAFTGGHEGVARGARLVAIKVAQDDPNSSRWTAFFSSIDSALQRVITLKQTTHPTIVAVNISIGTSTTFTDGAAACLNTNPTTNTLFATLQSLGVAPVLSAGNNGVNNAMTFPACLSNAFSVGATTDADVPASFTNSSAGLEWWAPGVNITAPVPTGNSVGVKDGTSMAAPHVAGAFALLRECVDGNGVPITMGAAKASLDSTGVAVTRNGVTRRRINVLDAATAFVNNNDFAFPEILPAAPGAGFNDFDFNVCADSEPGEPGPGSLDNSVWWSWTPAATGTATISTDDFAGNVTTFDTTLTVYTGNTLTSLQAVAYDDDSGVGLRSMVVMPVNAGTTYRVKVDGFSAANGLLNLHLENGPPPACFGVPATIVGSAAGDVINGTAGNDVIVAGDGNDTINALGGDDRICGDAGDDTINGGDGNDFVLGGSGIDTIRGDAGNDTLVGNPGGGSNDDGGDIIDGGAGDDFIDGWFGDDTLSGGPGNDHLRGEAGNDTVSYAAATAAVTASLATNAGTGEGDDTFVLVENLTGSAFADTLTGDGLDNVINGSAGADRIDGGPGNDTLLGGAGPDTLVGGAGNDLVNGGTGIDTLTYAAAPGAVVVDLAAAAATGDGTDTPAAIENVLGTPFDDKITGNGSANVLIGGAGKDTLNGGGGADTLNGGAANDTLNGGSGNDVLQGGAGADSLSGGAGNDTLSGGAGNDKLWGGAGKDALSGGAGNDTLRGEDGKDTLNGSAGVDKLFGGKGNDILKGQDGKDDLRGGAGNDVIEGGGGADTLRGEAGDDTLVGGNGADTLLGQAGNDTLRGGNGADSLSGGAGKDKLVGGAGKDSCAGGAGVDTASTCEIISGIP